MHETAQQRSKIWESPWYWVYLFCTAALVVLLLLRGRFGERQAQLERKFEAHRRGDQFRAGLPMTEEHVSTAGSTIIRLTPLYPVFATVLVMAWIGLWWTHFRPRRVPAQSAHAAESRAPP